MEAREDISTPKLITYHEHALESKSSLDNELERMLEELKDLEPIPKVQPSTKPTKTKTRWHYHDQYIIHNYRCKLCSTSWSTRVKVDVLAPWNPQPGEYSLSVNTCHNCEWSLGLMSKEEIIKYVIELMRWRK